MALPICYSLATPVELSDSTPGLVERQTAEDSFYTSYGYLTDGENWELMLDNTNICPTEQVTWRSTDLSNITPVTGTLQEMLDDFYTVGPDEYERFRNITLANWQMAKPAIDYATSVCEQGWAGQTGRKLLVADRSPLGKLRVRAGIRALNIFTSYGIAYGASALIAKSDPRTANAFGAGTAGLAISAYVFYDVEAWIIHTDEINVVKAVIMCLITLFQKAFAENVGRQLEGQTCPTQDEHNAAMNTPISEISQPTMNMISDEEADAEFAKSDQTCPNAYGVG